MFVKEVHTLKDRMGDTWAFTRSTIMDGDGQPRREDIIPCRAYARQHLEDIVSAPDDPFLYDLTDLWLDTFERPWAPPRTLNQLVEDLATKIASGELKAYVEDNPLWHMKLPYVPRAGGGDAEVGEADTADKAREQDRVIQSGGANSVSESIRPISKNAHSKAGSGNQSHIVDGAEKYESAPMNSKYLNEDNPVSFMRWNKPKVVKYLDESEQEAFELDVKDGLIVNKKTGIPFDTASAPEGAIFIMDPSGRVLASNYSKIHEFHHSSLAAGQPVASAGHMHVADGHLLEVSNVSGHYAPDQSLNNQLFDELENKGLHKNTTDEVMQTGWSSSGLPSEPRPHKEFRDVG